MLSTCVVFAALVVALNGDPQATNETACTTTAPSVTNQPENVVLVSDVLEQLSKEVSTMQNQHPLLKSLRLELDDLTSSIDQGNLEDLLMKIRELRRWFARFTIHHGVFSLLFKDLNNIIFRYSMKELSNAKWNELQTKLAGVINNHTLVDGTHFRWALADFVTLGLDDPPKPYSETVMFWYGDEMESARKAGYEMIQADAAFGGDYDPLMRFVLIEVTEFTGQHIFGLISEVYNEFYRGIDAVLEKLDKSNLSNDNGGSVTAKKDRILAIKQQCSLIYSGHEHSEAENGEMQAEGGELSVDILDGVAVSSERSASLMKGGHSVIAAISGLWNGSHKFSESNEGPNWTQFQ